jgi:serine/threonine-protein kinase
MMSEIASPQTPPSGRSSALVAERYQIVRELGRGGMGSVYEARHTWTGRKVALKTLLAHLASEPSAVERFRREARAGVVGAHPNIAEVLDMGVDPLDGTLYLALELLDGEDLARRLGRDRSLPPLEALALLVPAMMALDAAHRAGVIHRDIKPSNLFVARSADGSVRLKVIDFGIANLADAAPLTRSGAPMGTPQYMAPEQARGESDLDARADVWSMGVVCFEVLAGRRPFEGARYHDVLVQVLTGRPPSLRSVAPHLDSDLCAIVDRALEPERGRRHASMAAMAAALAALPAFEAEPWAVALRSAAAPQAPHDAAVATREGPVTLELQPDEAAVGAASDASVPPSWAPATPPATPSEAPPATVRRRGWRWAVVVALGLSLAVGLSLGATRRPPQRLVGSAPLVAPRAGPVPQPLPPSPPPPTLSAVSPVASPPPPAAAPSPTRPALSSDLRRAVVRRAARVEREPEAPVNGAPVLEP